MLTPPFLLEVNGIERDDWPKSYPFDIPKLHPNGLHLRFETPVTFFVGENGSGKSTLLEAIAAGCGFNPEGGNRNHARPLGHEAPKLTRAIRLAWRPKVTHGFFLRAESFFDFVNYVDKLEGLEGEPDPGRFDPYGGEHLHRRSHGQAFMALFEHKFRDRRGIYLLDEPEAALSPARQLQFLALLRKYERRGNAQFIIATHSPILLAYPGADIFSFDGETLEKLAYRDTEHYRITKAFLNNPEGYIDILTGEGEEA